MIDESNVRLTDIVKSMIERNIGSYFIILTRRNLELLSKCYDIKQIEKRSDNLLVLKDYKVREYNDIHSIWND